MLVNAIEVKGVWRIFKTREGIVEALKDVNLEIRKGELFGLLGPNGAGKTTLIRILTTLLLPTRGKAYVLGYDTSTEELKIRPLINMVSGGEYSGYGLLTVKENLWMFSQFYGIPGKIAKKRIYEFAEKLRFKDILNKKVRNLSTGQRQKMNIARGFLTDPKVIFLDEPTLGLDVEVAREIRKFVKSWIMERDNRTVVLTTHYMHEAEQLCDRVAIINEGRIIAVDTVENLKKRISSEFSLVIKVSPKVDISWISSIDGVLKYLCREEENGMRLRIIMDKEESIGDLVDGFIKRGGKINYLNKEEPTLEDVFLKLTGRGLE
ncbi:MAG: ABC transporter ATP-binding protein [Thermoplasmata archaeon]|nr:ABC transporter ATP-binding protein [Thermoplasmata archaeon]